MEAPISRREEHGLDEWDVREIVVNILKEFGLIERSAEDE